MTLITPDERGHQQVATLGRMGPVVPSRHPPDFCYLCGNCGADSDEHVVPRTLYRLSNSDNEGPQLRAHRRCNGGYSGDEEALGHRSS